MGEGKINRAGIVLAGNIVVDTIKHIDRFPRPGMLASISSVSQSVGGSVPNMGLTLRRMDPAQRVVGVGLVGDDANGDWVLGEMTAVGMDVGGVARVGDDVTAFTDVMTDSGTKERTFFHARGANARLGVEHLNFKAYEGCGLFHIAYALLLDTLDAPDAEYGTGMARALAMATDAGFVTSMDVVSEEGDRFATVVRPSLPHCDYLIVNEIEASRIVGIPARDGDGALLRDNLVDICRALISLGVRRLVAIHSPEGAWCVQADGTVTVRPSLQLPAGYIRTTVGAGDAFCAGMLYGLQHDWDVADAMDLGAGAAACVLGGQGVQPLSQIQGMLAQWPRRA